MDLNSTFDGVKNQILMQEPLPSFNKAYAMLQTIESQILVYKNFEEQLESNAMMVKTQIGTKTTNNKGPYKKMRRLGKRIIDSMIIARLQAIQETIVLR